MKAQLNNRRTKLFWLGLFTLLGIGLEAFLFSPIGPFMRLGNIDLNFLFAPLAILLVLFIFSAVVPIVMVNRYTLLFSTSLQYFALTVFTGLIFQRALLFSRLPFLTHHLDFLSSLAASAPYLALFWVGLGLYTISNLMIPGKRGAHFHRPFFAMAGYLLVGLALWKTLNIFSVYWTPLQGVGFVIGFSLIIVAVTRLSECISTPLTPLIDNILKWSLDNPVKLFWYAVLVMSYFIFARPLLYSISPYAYLIEWVVICFAGYQILTAVKNNLRDARLLPLVEDDWKRHQQINHVISDDDFNKMVILQEEFIQTGIRRNLLSFLRELLRINGVADDHVAAILQPLIEYSDARRRWYNRWFFKDKLARDNRVRRVRVLTESMNRIREVVYPPAILINGATHA